MYNQPVYYPYNQGVQSPKDVQTVVYQSQPNAIRTTSRIAPMSVVPYQNQMVVSNVVKRDMYENDSNMSDVYSVNSETNNRNYKKLLSGFHPYYDKVWFILKFSTKRSNKYVKYKIFFN